MLSSGSNSNRLDLGGRDFEALAILAPPSKERPFATSLRSITLKDGVSVDVIGAFSRASAADFRLLKATENLGM